MKIGLTATALVCGLAATNTPLANAQAADPAKPPEPATPAAPAAPAAAKGILPIPDYSGDFLNRAHLFGDFGGARTNLANKGVQFSVDSVQTVQSVVNGGLDTGTKYGGSLDYLLTLDFDRMGLMPGALLKFRAETRYGESVNSRSGSFLPVNSDGYFPLSSPSSDSIPFTITDLTYYQFLSEKFGLFVGKLDTFDGDPNEFAGGRGNSQFMNFQFLYSATMALLPYSTVGGGVIVMPTKKITISSSVLNLTDSSTTVGLDGKGRVWATEANFQYQLGNLPGGSNIGFDYLWNSDSFNFGGRFTLAPGESLTAPTKSDTWIAYLSGWQYLYTKEEAGSAPLNLLNGEPDLEGFGIFWRAGIADDNVNPTKWSISGGVGGKGMIPCREHDFYGVGYYYNNVQTSRLTDTAGLDAHTQGVECFYNIALTPAAQLTCDAQFIESVQSNLDTGVILGMRLKLEF